MANLIKAPSDPLEPTEVPIAKQLAPIGQNEGARPSVRLINAAGISN